MLSEYGGKIVRLKNISGKTFTGIAEAVPAVRLGEKNRQAESSILLNGYLIPESDIVSIEEPPGFAVLRASETWQQAGAYYVRIQAMAKKHHIPLRQEFDEHDGPDTRYIVVTDDDFPVATARMYPIDDDRMLIGRVVVLPEYRHMGIGTMVVIECEKWAAELHCSKAVLDSRDNKTAFYVELGYKVTGEPTDGDTFRCIRMEKDLAAFPPVP